LPFLLFNYHDWAAVSSYSWLGWKSWLRRPNYLDASCASMTLHWSNYQGNWVPWKFGFPNFSYFSFPSPCPGIQLLK
jgi:hypothetical protein